MIAPPPVRLSKSKFVAGVQCLKRLYYQIYQPELAEQADEGQQARLEQGNEVGLLALAKEQRVYIVAVGASSRNTSVTKADLELERYAKDQFKKRKSFRVASTLRESDFVFFVMLDTDSSRTDEIAVVILPSDYERAAGNLDTLRNAALWQSDNHFKNVGSEAALVGATLGMSMIFHRPNVVAGLVKQFHEQVLPKK